MVPSSVLWRLSLFPLAIVILRVAALYDTKWVGRALWTLSGLLYIITITLAMISLKGFYSEFVPTGIGEIVPPMTRQMNLCTSRCPGCAYRSISPPHSMGPLLSSLSR